MIIIIESQDNKKIALTNNSTQFEVLKANEGQDGLVKALLLGKYDLGTPDEDIASIKSNFEDGIEVQKILYKKRVMSIISNFEGGNEVELSEIRQSIASVISSKKGRLEVKFYRSNNFSDSENIFTLKEVWAKINFPANNRTTETQFLEITLTATNPYFHAEPKEIEFNNNLLGDGLQFSIEFSIEFEEITNQNEIINNGDTDIDVELIFSGVLNNMIITNNSQEGRFLQLVTNVSSIQELIVNGKNRIVTIDGVNAFDFLTEDSKFFELVTGINEIIFNAGNIDPNSKVKLRFQEKFLSI